MVWDHEVAGSSPVAPTKLDFLKANKDSSNKTMGDFEGTRRPSGDTAPGTNAVEAQELALFDEVFAVEREQDLADIKALMRRIQKDPWRGRLVDESRYEFAKAEGRLKYTDEQVEDGQWEADDLDFVIEVLRKEKIDKYFSTVADKYPQAMPVPDSMVRLDQEADIAEKLRSHMPVLIRGNWRMGKTSMVRSLETHQFGAKHSLFIDAMTEYLGEEESLEDFQNHFGADSVVEFIVEREFGDVKPKDRYPKEDEIKQQMTKSRKSPFEFLNEYLAQKDEEMFLSLDEVVGFIKQPEKMKYLASLKDLSQIRLAIVLHRIASFEDSFQEIFVGYETHFVRPLIVEEVGRLVRKPLDGTKITFTDDAIRRILEFTGGRPMEVNQVCRALMTQFSEHKNYRFSYRAEDIDALTGKKYWELQDAFRSAIDNYRQVYNRSMNDVERALIDRLILEGEVSTSDMDADAVQPLIDTTFVAKDETKGVYRVNGTLFKQVLLGLQH